MVVKQHPVQEYFSNIVRGIVTTAVGMKLTWGYFWRTAFKGEAVTMRYPEVRPEINEAHRGLHEFREEDCIACNICALACPVDCIDIVTVGKGKDTMLRRFKIDYTKCLFCNLCCEPCPKDCIWMGAEYDLSARSRDGCTIEFASPKTEEQFAAHQAELDRKEAEKKAALAAKKKADAEKKAKEEAEKKAEGESPEAKE